MNSTTGNLSIRHRASWTPMWMVITYAGIAALWKLYFQLNVGSLWAVLAFFWSPWSAGISLLIWVTWAAAPIRRLPQALMAAIGIAIFFQCIFWSLPFRDGWLHWKQPAFSATNLAVPLLGWIAIFSAIVRVLTGLRLTDPPGNEKTGHLRWQFRIWDVVLVTAGASFVLAAVTQLYSSIDVREGSRIFSWPLSRMEFLIWLLPVSLAILPVALAAAFSLKRLPVTLALVTIFWWVLIAAMCSTGGRSYESPWNFVADTFDGTMVTASFLFPIIVHTAALVLVLRWQGYRLTCVKCRSAASSESAVTP